MLMPGVLVVGDEYGRRSVVGEPQRCRVDRRGGSSSDDKLHVHRSYDKHTSVPLRHGQLHATGQVPRISCRCGYIVSLYHSCYVENIEDNAGYVFVVLFCWARTDRRSPTGFFVR